MRQRRFLAPRPGLEWYTGPMMMASISDSALLTAADFRVRAERALYREPLPIPGAAPSDSPTAPSDFDLNPGAFAEFGGDRPPRPAAVLVPVVVREPLTLLFTERTHELPAHAGQISFPGGKIDDQDAGPADAAFREAMEEIGLAPAHIELLGFLDTYRTGTGFAITPVVALVEPGFTLSLNRREVADAFEVPLPFLMDERNHRLHSRMIAGRERHYHAMPYGERYIWGATAGILKNMHERMFRP